MSLIYDAIRENEAPTSGSVPTPALDPSRTKRSEYGQTSIWSAVIVFLVIVVLGALVLAWWYNHTRTIAFARPMANEAVTGTTGPAVQLRSQTAAANKSGVSAAIVESPPAAIAQASADAINEALPLPLSPTAVDVAPKANIRNQAEEFPMSAATVNPTSDHMATATTHSARRNASAEVSDAPRWVPAQSADASARDGAPSGSAVHASRASRKSSTASKSNSDARSGVTETPAMTSARESTATAHQDFDAFMLAMQSNDLATADARFATLKQELGPNSLTLLRAQSWLALAHKDLVSARSGYTALLERLPGDEEASINLASIELQENHVAAARAVLSDALRTHPDSEVLNGAIARFRGMAN